MCSGISLSRRELPDALIEQHRLRGRITSRSDDGEQEVQFMAEQRPTLLPVWYSGQLLILPWGNRDRDSRLPMSCWCPREQLDAGRWEWLRPEPATIPATLAYERGVWFQVTESLSGIVVKDEARSLHVYLLTEPANHYYEVMTRSKRMPAFTDQG